MTFIGSFVGNHTRGGLNPDGSTVGATSQPQAFTEGLQGTLIVKNPEPTYGAELVVNGTFDGNADGWTLNAGWAYNDHKITYTGATNDYATQEVALTQGKYLLSVTANIPQAGTLTFDAYSKTLDFTTSGTQVTTVPYITDYTYALNCYATNGCSLLAVSLKLIIDHPAITLQASASGNETRSYLETVPGKAFGITVGNLALDIGKDDSWNQNMVSLRAGVQNDSYGRLSLDTFGELVLFRFSDDIYTVFAQKQTQVSQRYIDIPDADGTLALLSDIPQAAYCNPATATVADVISALIAAGLMASS